MCLSLSLQRLLVLPWSGAHALGDGPSSSLLLEGTVGLVGAAAAPVGPIAVGRGGLSCSGAAGCSVGTCPVSGSVGEQLCLCQGCPFSVPCCWATLQACNCSPSPGGTAMLHQEMPLQMENKTTWRDGRCFLRAGRRGCIVLEC